jgi:hypothetical protein
LNNENLIIEPSRKYSRNDSFVSILIGLVGFAFMELLSPYLIKNSSNKIPFTNSLFFAISTIYIVYVLSRKIYQIIEIDYKNNNLKIKYLTLFRKNCETNISFEELKYEYKKIASKFGGKWTLIIWKSDKKILNLEQGYYGFEKEKIDFLVEKLKELK